MIRGFLTKSACCVLLSGVAAGPVVAQTTTAINDRDLMQRVQVLAHDSMLGRDAGGIGNVKATSYVANELARMGLVEAGESGYFQLVPLVTRGPVREPRLIINGVPAGDGSIASARPMAGMPFGGVFDRANVETVYGGVIGGTLVDPSLVRGRVVVFHALRDPRNAVTGAYAGAPGTLDPYRDAAAVLLVGLDLMPVQVAGGLRTSRYMLADPAADGRKVPAGIISQATASAIFGIDLERGPGTAGAAITAHFGLVDTPVMHPARNVVGIIRGTDPVLRNEYVAIGAHTDHVGVGTPVDHDSVRITNQLLRPLGANDPPRAARTNEAEIIRQVRANAAASRPVRMDSIFNGADDNASGTAVALELAEYFVKNPPKRSLLFVFHTAEEKGLFGAEYFTDHPTVPRDAIVAQINMDQVSRGGPADVAGSEPNTVYLLGTRRLSTQLGDLVEAVNGKHKLRLDYSLDAPGHPANGYCRSDHYMYARYSIPIVFVSAGWHRDYHMVTDEPQYSDPRTMVQIGAFVGNIVEEVANLRERPLVDQPRMNPSTPCRQ